jgi:YD repeat-containing protein
VDANGSGTVLNTNSYAFDVADRMTLKTENGVSTTYAYDKLGQVTADGATSYAYDAAGNRTIAGYTTTAGNRTTTGNGWTYGFDDLGQVTSKTQGGTTWTYPATCFGPTRRQRFRFVLHCFGKSLTAFKPRQKNVSCSTGIPLRSLVSTP